MGTESEADHWLVLSELAGWEPRPVEKPSAANSCPGVLEFPRFLRGPRIFLIQPLSLQRESYVPLYARRTRGFIRGICCIVTNSRRVLRGSCCCQSFDCQLGKTPVYFFTQAFLSLLPPAVK